MAADICSRIAILEARGESPFFYEKQKAVNIPAS